MILAPHGTHRRMTLHLLHGMDLRETIRLPLGIIRQDMTDQVDFLNMTETTGKDMDIEQQNENWERSTPEFRDAVRELYSNTPCDGEDFNNGVIDTLAQLYGEDNVSSMTEPKRSMIVKYDDVCRLMQDCNHNIYLSAGIHHCITTLFGKNFIRIIPDSGKANEYQNTQNSGELKPQEVEYELDPCKEKVPMKENELNLGEFIKDCEGETFFHPRYGEVVINDINDEMIEIGIDGHGLISIPTKNNIFQSGLAQLYPNDEYFKKYAFDGHSAWMEWKTQRESMFRKPECTITDVNKWWELKVVAKFHSAEEAEKGAETVRLCLKSLHENHTGQ